jgi:superfamily I DNA/RNA helicase
MAALLRSPYLGYGTADLAAVTRRPGESLFEKIIAENNPRANWIVGVVEKGTFEVKPALAALFSHSGYWPRDPAVLLALLPPLSVPGLTLSDAVERIAIWEKQDILYQSDHRSAPDAVELMTVHGAKGLEFPHVFLVDNLRRSSRQQPALLLDPSSLPGLRYRRGEETVTTPEYERLRETREAVADEESRRILYVALTRAKESLTVLLPEDRSQIPRGTWGEMLVNAAVSASDRAAEGFLDKWVR